MHTIKAYYRPDDYPEFLPWKEFTQNLDIIGQAGALTLGGVPVARAGFAPRMSFNKPPNRCDPVSKRQLRRGFEFQVKLKGTGYCVLNRFRIHAKVLVEQATSKQT